MVDVQQIHVESLDELQTHREGDTHELRRTHQDLQLTPDESVISIAAMVPNRTATSMAMVPLEMLWSTRGLTCVAQDVKCEMARQSDSSQNLFIRQCFHEYANIRVTEQSQCGIPNVGFNKFIWIRRGERGRSVRDIQRHPKPST